MEYIEVSRSTTVTTIVEFQYNGETITIVVPHFQPASEQDIQLGIQNRIATEIKNREESL